LGAGFSRPLGGPLLTTILSRATGNDLAVRYPDTLILHDDTSAVLRSLYHYGRRFPEGVFGTNFHGTPGELMWGDPEEFLEYLDMAALSPRNPLRDRIGKIVAEHMPRGAAGVDDLRHAGRRQMAAECCAFLQHADVRSEKWRPFVDWANELGESDTIVTYNYDRVVEMLGGKIDPIINEEDLRVTRLAKRAPLLKLHGSVDWCIDSGTGAVTASKQEDSAISCTADQLAIATPGPTKSKTAATFKLVWDTARKAIQQASAVVFVGYRFPPSDAESRTFILDALAANKCENLDLHVVLGSPSFDTDRLRHLLEFACKKADREHVSRQTGSRGVYSVQVHPLWGQDFLSVWSRALLFH
jgi:hypothetical protein